MHQLQLTRNSSTVRIAVNISFLNISYNRRNKKNVFRFQKIEKHIHRNEKWIIVNTIDLFSPDQLNGGQEINGKVFFQTEKTFRFHFVVLSVFRVSTVNTIWYIESEQHFFYRIGNNSSLIFFSFRRCCFTIKINQKWKFNDEWNNCEWHFVSNAIQFHIPKGPSFQCLFFHSFYRKKSNNSSNNLNLLFVRSI